MTQPNPLYARPVPDIVGAVRIRLMNAAPIAAYTIHDGVNHVATELSRAWTMPGYAIVISPAGGPPGDFEIALRKIRLDITCFGPGKSLGVRRRLADELWRTVDAVLSPSPHQGIPMGWTGGHCFVHSVLAETGWPIRGVEQGTDWAKVTQPYVVTFGALPI